MKLVTMMLGDLEFSVPEGTFQTRERNTSYRIDVAEPIEGLGRPVYRGLQSDRIRIRGVVFPGFSGKAGSVQRFRDFAEKGESALLVDGEGNIFGAWMLADVDETEDPFTPTGLARKKDYSLTLIRDPEEASQTDRLAAVARLGAAIGSG